MDRLAFDRAREEAGRAAQKIAEIQKAKTLQEIEGLWSDYLTHIQRSCTKLRIACKSGPSKGWCDNVFHIRNADELLKYVLHARHADEHGVAKVTEVKPGSLTINPKQGNRLEVDHLEIRPDGIVMGPKVAANAKVTLTPGEVLLAPVRNRGITYDVPKMHLGQKLESGALLEVAQRAEHFLRGKLDEAASKF